MHSHFQSDPSQENARLVHIELNDPLSSLKEKKVFTFVLFERKRNEWHNNNQKNYHFELSIPKFREGISDNNFSMEKEITEYLEYQEHHKKLRTVDVKE